MCFACPLIFFFVKLKKVDGVMVIVRMAWDGEEEERRKKEEGRKEEGGRIVLGH